MNKLTRTLIKAAGWGASAVLVTVILTFQLFIKVEIPRYTKIGVPALIAALILFFVAYKYLKAWINRKLTAMETAKTLGHTISPVYAVLNDILIVVPILLTAGVFLMVGVWSHTVGLILLECSGALQLGFGSNLITRLSQNATIKQAEIDKITANNTAVAKEVKRLMTVNETEVEK
jgi:hypothetical protein